jgi:hypothetical protein
MSNVKIVSLESLLAYRFSEMDFSKVYPSVINYSWGNETDVAKWILDKDNSRQTSGVVYSFNNNIQTRVYDEHIKYPLIWLNCPTDGEPVSGGSFFEKVELIITTNASKEAELNTVKWTKTIPLVTKIAQFIVDNFMGGRVRIENLKGVYSVKWRYFPEYTVAEYDRFDSGQGIGGYKHKTIDIWDAIKITMNLYVNDDCLNEEDINSALKCFKYNINI